MTWEFASSDRIRFEASCGFYLSVVCAVFFHRLEFGLVQVTCTNRQSIIKFSLILKLNDGSFDVLKSAQKSTGKVLFFQIQGGFLIVGLTHGELFISGNSLYKRTGRML